MFSEILAIVLPIVPKAPVLAYSSKPLARIWEVGFDMTGHIGGIVSLLEGIIDESGREECTKSDWQETVK